MEELFKKNRNKIEQLLNYALDNPYSDFYRNKYNGEIRAGQISTYADLQKVPLLSKDEILAVPIEKRTFVPAEQVARYSFSSGTTNRNIFLAVPHADRSFSAIRLSDDYMSSFGVKQLLVLLAPFSPLRMKLFASLKKKIIPVPGDINNLQMTAILAKKIGVQGIVSTPTVLYFLINYLQEIDFDMKSIKWLSLGGELCSKQKFAYFKHHFPEAQIIFRYACTEIGNTPLGYQCDSLAGKSPKEYHPCLKGLIEIIGSDGKQIAEGEAGEIVYTDFKSKAFPFIRYRIGDIGSIVKKECSCGEQYLLKLGGRVYFDALKFHEVTLYTQLIEASLEETSSFIYPRYQMHVFENHEQGRIMPQLVLKVQLKNDQNESSFLKKIIQETVSSKLFLSADKTLSYFVKNKIFLPLEVEFVEWPQTTTKFQNIVSHLS